MENLKRANHYVFRHYLEAWESDGRLSCLIENQVKRINTVNLAVENDFYHLPILNEAEIAFVIRAAKMMPERGRKANQNFIEAFALPTYVRRLLNNNASDDSELTRTLRAYETNAEEEWHTHIESLAIPILKEIKAGDVSFYTDNKRCAEFMYFLALQLARTRKMRDAQTGYNEKYGIDLRKVGQITSHFMAVNLGANLFGRRHDDPITLIVNNTNIGLITCDQPVINLYAGDDRAKTLLAVYYPVSPTTAIAFGDLESVIPKPVWNVDEAQVRKLNDLMLYSSHKMSFAEKDADFFC